MSKWESIGPRNITGVIRTLASHPSNEETLYAGAEFGGVWKTTDGGRNWYPTMDDEINLNVRALGICRNQPDVIYAAMSPGIRGGLVYLSLNGALSWLTLTDVGSSETQAIGVHPSARNIVYIAGDRSLHKSTSGGMVWPINDVVVDGRSQVNRFGIFDGYIDDVKIDPENPETVYISVRGRGIFKTKDGGNTWTSKGSSITFDVVDDEGNIIKDIGFARGFRILLAIGEDRRPGRNGTQFIVAKVQGTILVSRNGGDSWDALPGEDHGYDSQNSWCSCIAICPTDQDFIVAGGSEINFTLNASDDNPDWKSLPNNSLHEDQQDISFTLSNPDNFYFANDGFIGKSIIRGAKVSKISDGLVAGQCFNAGVSQTGNFVVGCSTYHTGIIRTGTATLPIWEYIGCCEGGLFEIDPHDEDIIFMSPWGSNNLRRSRTGGKTWENLSVDKESLTDFYVTVIGIHPRDSKKIFACSFFGRLHWSTDGGDTWDLVKNPDKTPLIIDGGTARLDCGTCFAYDSVIGDDLYLGTRNGRLWRTTSSSTVASGWQELNTPYPPGTGRTIRTISVDPERSDTIYIGYALIDARAGWPAGESAIWRGIFNDVGVVSWTDISGAYISTSLPKFSVNSLIVDQEDNRLTPKIYAATDVGVFITKNGGKSWEKFNDGLPNTSIVDMRLRSVDGALIVSAWGRGIYSKRLRPLLSFPDPRSRFWYVDPFQIERLYSTMNDPLYLRLVEHINDLEQRLAAQGNASALPEERPYFFNGTLEKAQVEIRRKHKQALDMHLREQQKNDFREQQKNDFREQQTSDKQS